MTDSGSSLHQDDSEDDIYDFPVFNFEDELTRLEGSNKAYKQEALELSEKVKALTEDNQKLQKLNEILGKNISTLLKTAKAEVRRKDAMITNLRLEVESLTCTENNKLTVDKVTSTHDLKSVVEVQVQTKESDIDRTRKKEKSHDNKNRYDNHHKPTINEEKKSENADVRLRSADCDKDRRLGYRDSTKSNFRSPSSDYEKFSERHRGSRYRRSGSHYKKSFRHDRRNHLKYDSLDKLRYSRRSPHRRTSSKEMRNESLGKEKSGSGRYREKSRSRERERKEHSGKSSRNKNYALEKSTNESQYSKDLISILKEPINHKLKESNTGKEHIKTEKSSKERENLDVLNKEKITNNDPIRTNEKKKDIEMTSPLNDLYSETFALRNSNRFSSNSSGTLEHVTELENGGLRESVETRDNQPEDWMLSFKNERKNDKIPLTLYSKRMIQKLALESQSVKTERLKEKEGNGDQKENNSIQICQLQENKNSFNTLEVEKEPGELTDDEQVVESTQEFQEIAKVASIENSLSEKQFTENNSKENFLFKEPVKRVSVAKKEKIKKQTLSSEFISKDDFAKDSEELKESKDVIEFSPFKNNYKLIAISPIKPPETKHILDFYNIRFPTHGQTQKEVESSVLNILSSLSAVPINNGKNNVSKIDTTEKECETEKEDICNYEKCHTKPGKNVETSEKESKDNCSSTEIVDNIPKSSKSKKTKSLSIKEKETSNVRELNERIHDSAIINKCTAMPEKNTTEVTSLDIPELLDFLTSSPTKHNIDDSSPEIGLPAKSNLSLSEGKSEIDEKTSVTTESLTEKESWKNSSSEKDFEEGKLSVKNSKLNLRLKRVKSSEKVESDKDERKKKIEKTKETLQFTKRKREKTKKTEEKIQEIPQKKAVDIDNNLGRGKRRVVSKNFNEKPTVNETNKKRKREHSVGNEKGKTMSKKKKSEEKLSPIRRTRSKNDSKSEPELQSEKIEDKPKEDISSFQFFKPITKADDSKIEPEIDLSLSSLIETKTMMGVSEYLCMETPNKSVDKFKNLFINEQTVLDTKSRSIFSPLIGSKSVEMTPRRLLKNDLTLTDSEDDSATIVKKEDEKEKDENEYSEKIDKNQEQDEEEEEDNEDSYSESDSDSGASDFVDLL